MKKTEYEDSLENGLYDYEMADEISNDDFEEVRDSSDAEPMSEAEVEIVGVNFKKNGKVYYFNPVDNTYQQGTNVIVETARGLEYGTVIIANKTISSKEITLPLRNVVRLATEEDDQHYKENKEKEIDAYNVCVRKIAEHGLTMKLVDVEYTFDNTKLLFYFTADGRIDFRDLVKDLASVFKTRIELRQIGIRDEAKIIGGLGMCGRPFCCHSFLSDFVQVSIKMAKEQNLSLNSTKISGACGRLMCCLRYEYDVYEEEIKKTPKIDSYVMTPDGDGIVIETMPLAGLVKVQFSGKQDTPPKVFHRDNVTVCTGPRPAVQKQDDTDSSDTAEAKEANGTKSSKHRSNRVLKQTQQVKEADKASDTESDEKALENNVDRDLSDISENTGGDDNGEKNDQEAKENTRPRRRRRDFRNRRRDGEKKK